MFYWNSALVVKPKDSSVVPVDLVNAVESICNPLEKKDRQQMFSHSLRRTVNIP